MNRERTEKLLELVHADFAELAAEITHRLEEIAELERLIDLGGDLAAAAGPQWMRCWSEFRPLTDRLERAHLALARRNEVDELIRLAV